MKNPSDFLQVDTLILGGGLTGLSTAYHLEKAGRTDYLLVEQNGHFGGLCASEQIDGFTFDLSGHVLHLRDPYALRLVRQLLRGNLLRVRRRAFIDFDGRRVPYPFQYNLWALPPQTARECLQEALAAAQARRTARPKNFEQWCLQAWGEGIYRHFMQPYNQKLWQNAPSQLAWDWCGDFVPAPDLAALQAGARRRPARESGYNAQFYYPRQGGIGALAQALADRVPNTWLHARVQKIDLKRKQALIGTRRVRFARLVNTLPLKDFIQICDAPPAVQAAACALKSVPVHVLQLALKRPAQAHWVYFAQADIPFHRVGAYSAFCPENAPQGCGAFYAETTAPVADFPRAKKAFIKALKQKGIIEKQDQILFSFWRKLPVAYAVYDLARARHTARILRWLQQHRCYCAGRYGLWEYSFMERSLLQGRDLAQKLQSSL